MKKLFFGNPEDTILAIKIKHFSRKYCTESGIKKYMRNNHNSEYDKLLERIKEVKEHYNTEAMKEDYPQKDRKNMEKIFIDNMIAHYFTKNIIPQLVDSKFFDTYIIAKKIDKKTQKEVLDHTDGYATSLF